LVGVAGRDGAHRSIETRRVRKALRRRWTLSHRTGQALSWHWRAAPGTSRRRTTGRKTPEAPGRKTPEATGRKTPGTTGRKTPEATGRKTSRTTCGLAADPFATYPCCATTSAPTDAPS